ncbi:MAG: PhoH family protein [Tannerella sp.]|jgi:phosphate starvation-inducible PhoH-like protein|nr:PhoH family protein [Tannerella sp.]
MIERIYILESVDLVAFYGVNNVHMQLIKTLFPKLRIVARGNVMKIIGDEEELDAFIRKVREIEDYCEEYNALTEDVIMDIVKERNVAVSKQDHLIIHGVSGRAIVARTENQQRLVKSFEENDLVFTVGPAGTGKTFVAIALAVRALKNRQARKIILSRPAVEAGEKLGFLPGEMKDKLDPYLQPLYDALQEMIPAVKLKEYMENNVIQIAPLAYMRGRTLNDAVIILDEAQNTTAQQIKMFLTRLGLCAKMIVTGDVTQIDLPPTATSGLVQAMHVLRKVQGVGKVEFTKNDIVRHRLVQRIVEAYENAKAETASPGNREKTNEGNQ